MFQTFVIGPVGTRGFGLARRCVECREQAPGESACNGFGAGCLAAPPREGDTRAFAPAPLVDIDARLRAF